MPSVSPATESFAMPALSVIALKSIPPVLLPESKIFSVSMSASFFFVASELFPRFAMLSERSSVLSAALPAPAAVSSIAAPSPLLISRAVAPTEATTASSPAMMTSQPAVALSMVARVTSFGMSTSSTALHPAFTAFQSACAFVAAGIATAAPTAIPSIVFALGDIFSRYCPALFKPSPRDITSGEISPRPSRAIVTSVVAVGRSRVPRSAVRLSS